MSAVQESYVFLLENDQNITSTIDSLCEKGQLTLHCFQSWEDLNSSLAFRTPNCLIMSDTIGNDNTTDRISHITSKHTDLPVIILGQQHNLLSAVASIQAGAIDYIEKPAVSGRLAAHISTLGR